MPDTPDRSATAFDYLWSGGRPTVLVSEPDEVRAQGEKLTQQIHASHDEALGKGQHVPPPSELVVGWDEAASWLDGATALETLSLDECARTSFVSAGARVLRPCPGLGGRDPPRPRGRGHDCLHRQLGGARRAHDRAARRLRDLRGADRARRGCPHRGRPRRHRPPVARVQAARGGTPALGRDRRLRRRAEDARAAAAVGHPHVPLRFPRPESRRSRRPRRPRHRRVRRSQAHRRRLGAAGVHGAPLRRARTSSSSRSSGSISSRSTPAPRARRSTSSAEPRGRRRRPASRRPCATWPRSC